MSWDDKEKAAYRFHTDLVHEAIQLWVDGFNLIHSNLSSDSKIRLSKEQRFRAGLIASAINSMRCIITLATTGYFMQAMNLSRLLAEISTTYWYLKFFPEEYGGFDSPNREEPRMSYMLRKLESDPKKIESHPDAPEGLYAHIHAIRDFIRNYKLHKYSHVSKLTVPATIEENLCGTTVMTFGPQMNKDLYYGVFHDTLPLVLRIFVCTLDLMNLLVLAPTEELIAYGNRLSLYCEEAAKADKKDEGTAGTV